MMTSALYHKAMRPVSDQMLGTVLRTSAVPDFILSETTYAPGFELPEHRHQSSYFCLVLQGAYTEAYANVSRMCEPATLIFHPPNEIHSDRFHRDGARCFNVQMEACWLERVRKHTKLLDCSRHFYGGSLASLGIRLYKEFRELDEVSPLAIEGLVLEIVAEASRRSVGAQSHRRPCWLNQTREILHSRFSEQLTLSAIAELVEVHPVHLARTFRRHHGCTVGEYTRRLRVEFACRQLTRSPASLSEIALAAGFSHQSHFSRTFKSLIGMTPAEYRMLSRSR